MGEFIALAAQDEMQPKVTEMEVKSMKENTRTLAFQVPESLYQRVNAYKERNHMTLRSFVLGLIEEELDRDEELLRKQQEGATPDEEEVQDDDLSESSEAPVSAGDPDNEYEDEQEEAAAVGESESGFDEPGEEKSEQNPAEPEYAENPDEDFTELEDGEFPEEDEQSEALSASGEAPVSEDSPGDEYQDEQDEAPAVGDSESGFDAPDDEEPEQGIAEAPPDCGFIEGELGTAVEVAPYPGFGEDDQPAFPEPEDGEDQEYGGMGMGY